jgi:hypothetical protein
VAVLSSSDNNIQCREFALQFEPGFAPSAGRIGRLGIFDHQALVATRARRVEFIVESRDVAKQFRLRQPDRPGAARNEFLQFRAPCAQRFVDQNSSTGIQQIPADENNGRT